MMRKVYIITFMLVIGLLLVSCETEVENHAGTRDYYPNADQSEWIYKDVISENEFTYRLNGTAQHSQAGEVQVLEITYSGNTSKRYVLVTDEMAVLYFDLTSDARYELLHFPINVGDTWNWVCGTVEYSAVVQGREEVNTEAGDFADCFKVQYSCEGSPVDTIWYANGVGMVREAFGNDYDLKLKSYNFPP